MRVVNVFRRRSAGATLSSMGKDYISSRQRAQSLHFRLRPYPPYCAGHMMIYEGKRHGIHRLFKTKD